MTDRTARLVLVAVFIAAVVLVNPIGNFPLDDDWGVGFTTFTFLHSGRIVFTPFASATAYLQFVWGALWAALFGETFTVLRCSVLALSLGAALMLYALLRRAGASVTLALFGASALLFHPMFFWASFTSMTHVPFVFASVVAAYAFVRAWDDERWLAIAFAAVVASFFTRQFAVLNALAPLIVCAIARRRRPAVVYACALVVFLGLVLSGVLVGSQKELALHRPSIAHIATRGVHYLFFHWQNIGLFFAPVLLLVRRRLSRIGAIAAAIAFAYPLWRMTWKVRMPIPYMNSGNVFTNFGLGPPTLRDVFTLGMPHPFALPFDVRVLLMIVTALLGIAAAALVVSLTRDATPLVRYAVVYLVCGTLIVMGMSIYFDRYSIDAAWPFVLLLLAGTRRIRIAMPLLVVAIVFSICGTAEYLAWNRARWEAYADLRAHGVRLEQMDGGYEINSMLALRAGRKDLGKPGVGVVDDEYVIAFNRELPGYVPLRAYTYPRWLGLSRGTLYVQKTRRR